MIKQIQLVSLVFILFTPVAMAGTVIQIQKGHELSTILTDGKQARMNMGATDYAIVNYENESVKVVDPQKARVMWLKAEDIPSGNKVENIQTSIKHLGAGPVVAGFKTQKYAFSAKGRSCGVIYASKEALNVNGVENLLNALKTMLEKQQAMMGGFVSMMDDCLRADIALSDHVKTIGVPLLKTDNGTVDFEVKSIQSNVNLPPDTFVVPATYRTVTANDEMQRTSKNRVNLQQKVQQYQPQIQQMVQQMQQSGQISPQAMEQLRRVQGMMQ